MNGVGDYWDSDHKYPVLMLEVLGIVVTCKNRGECSGGERNYLYFG